MADEGKLDPFSKHLIRVLSLILDLPQIQFQRPRISQICHHLKTPSTRCRDTSSTSSPPGFWAALNTTYYAGGRTTVDGEKGPEPGNVRVGLTTALSLTRHQSTKLSGSTGVYHRTANDFWAVGITWQYRWGGGL